METNVRSIWGIFISVLQEILDFRNQQTTGVVELYMKQVGCRLNLGVVGSVPGPYLVRASVLKHLRPRFVVDDAVGT